MPERPVRKNIRLPDYDYSRPGYYFVTVCTRERKNLFWDGRCGGRPMAAPTMPLSETGKLAAAGIENIAKVYAAARVDKFCIMPNHVHLILILEAPVPVGAANGRPPSLKRVVNQYKGYVSRQAGKPIWQKGYYERVIRTQREYREIWRYIDENPLHWMEDTYCAEG